MTSAIGPGSKIKCVIGDEPWLGWDSSINSVTKIIGPHNGQICIVDGIAIDDRLEGFYLQGFNVRMNGERVAYARSKFIPIEETEVDISVFTQILDKMNANSVKIVEKV